MIPPAVEYVAKLAAGTLLLIAYAATGRWLPGAIGIALIIEPIASTYLAAYVASKSAERTTPDDF